MQETVIKESLAHYFKSATNMLQGYLVLTNKRVFYSGTQVRAKMNHGAIGNIIRDKMESAMGYDKLEEQNIFDIPLSDIEHGMKRFGFSKRLVLKDRQGNEFKLMIGKAERQEWPEAIDKAKAEFA